MDSLKEIQQLYPINLHLPSHKEEAIKIALFLPEKKDQQIPEYECGVPVLPFAASEVWQARVINGRTLCARQDGYKPVYELTLDVSGSNFANKFNPGDSIGIIPSNESKDVDLLLNRLGLLDQADCPYLLENVRVQGKTQIPKHIPVESTLRYTFTYCVELRAVVKKLFLLALSKFTSDVDDKRCLEVLCSKEGSDAYTDYILGKNINLIDLLQLLPSCSPPVECVLGHLPRLLPRPYSIVNSRLKDPNSIKICFSVINSPDHKKGLTTAWLENIVTGLELADANERDLEESLRALSVTDKFEKIIPMYLRKNVGFALPIEPETPILMVGPGTGVAPFIGLMEERMLIKRRDPAVKLGEAWLFYGCRNPDVDYNYKEAVTVFLENKILSRITTSFSRIENNGIKYVQDAIKMHSEDVAEFIMNGAMVCVCGDLLKMATCVQDALTHCLERHGGRSAEEAARFITDMKRNKKFLVDVWS